MDFLENKIEEEIQNGVIPGMSYAIIDNDQLYLGAHGFKDLIPEKTPINNDTLYDLASLTKVVVTVPLILKTIEKGNLRFADKVKDYLPRFKYDDVSIYDLLTHSSGLPADTSSKKIVTRDEIMDEIYNMDKIYDTKSYIMYSDIGYILLGEIISTIYGKPLDIVAREELFEPLEMFDTTYNPSDKEKCAPTEVTLERGIIKGVVHDEKASSLGGVAGHAGAFSTAVDLSKYISMILNKGEYKGKRILGEEMVNMLFNKLVYDKTCDWDRSFSFIVGNNDIVIMEGENIISFNGFTGPSISIDRENNFGIALMTNRVHPTRTNTKISRERPIISHEIYEELVRTKRK